MGAFLAIIQQTVFMDSWNGLLVSQHNEHDSEKEEREAGLNRCWGHLPVQRTVEKSYKDMPNQGYNDRSSLSFCCMIDR